MRCLWLTVCGCVRVRAGVCVSCQQVPTVERDVWGRDGFCGRVEMQWPGQPAETVFLKDNEVLIGRSPDCLLHPHPTVRVVEPEGPAQKRTAGAVCPRAVLRCSIPWGGRGGGIALQG